MSNEIAIGLVSGFISLFGAALGLVAGNILDARREERERVESRRQRFSDYQWNTLVALQDAQSAYFNQVARMYAERKHLIDEGIAWTDQSLPQELDYDCQSARMDFSNLYRRVANRDIRNAAAAVEAAFVRVTESQSVEELESAIEPGAIGPVVETLLDLILAELALSAEID